MKAILLLCCLGTLTLGILMYGCAEEAAQNALADDMDERLIGTWSGTADTEWGPLRLMYEFRDDGELHVVMEVLDAGPGEEDRMQVSERYEVIDGTIVSKAFARGGRARFSLPDNQTLILIPDDEDGQLRLSKE